MASLMANQEFLALVTIQIIENTEVYYRFFPIIPPKSKYAYHNSPGIILGNFTPIVMKIKIFLIVDHI